jgi:nucleotide-binding universal stress UspA family protein
LAATDADDLLILDDTALGRALGPALARTPASVLCLHSDHDGTREVLVAWRSGKAGRRTLTAAVLMAMAAGRGLTVLLPGADKAAAAARQAAEDQLGGLDLPVRYHRLAGGRRGLQAAARRQPGAIVVWTAGRSDAQDEARLRRELESVLGGARCSVLLVR